MKYKIMECDPWDNISCVAECNSRYTAQLIVEVLERDDKRYNGTYISQYWIELNATYRAQYSAE